MKKLFLFVAFTWLSVSLWAQEATITVSPETFNENEEITITVSGIDTEAWGGSDIYLWAWYFDLNDEYAGDSPTNGSWESSNESQKFTNNNNDTYSFTFTPSQFYGVTEIGKIGILAKTKNGTHQTADFLFEVGKFQLQLENPTDDLVTLNQGETLQIKATTSVPANFELFANGVSIETQNNTSAFEFNTEINQKTDFELKATSIATKTVLTKNFSVLIAPTSNSKPVPNGMLDGINLTPGNPATATLVLFAPEKEFVHAIGNFHDNNWSLSEETLMNYDAEKERFWITLNNLEKENILFQYVIEGEIRVADPYSTYVLNEFNDPYITDVTFENFPEYPTGKTEFMVTWFQTNPEAYEWQIDDFERPEQEDLVIYELLIRDFVKMHSYDAVVEKLDYLENLGVNAIELMPVSEFDGNISWGYNPAFHMALDKYYGSKKDFKAFVDAAHARGMAVILDVVYNHATGQNPYYRMWNDCNGCYTGKATPENPFFNTKDANTAFQFFNDIDHESEATQQYIDRLNQFWLTEYNIDGFRFDFTKGFTNKSGDGGSFDQSRIDILTRMYTELREVDPTAYVILEHFAPNEEESILINFRATSHENEPGMLVWSNHNYAYNEATMGYNENSDFSWISYQKRGWKTPSNVAYFESHDEERLMFKNLEYGAAQGDYNVKELSIALERMKTAAAFFFTIPGPKMIWQFGELGYDYSINHCPDGSISNDCRTAPKPIVWDYLNKPDRKAVYDAWAKLIDLKLNEPIFGTSNFTLDVAATNGLKKIQLTAEESRDGTLEFVTVLGNFGLISQNIIPEFKETGTWINLLTGSEREVTNVNAEITLAPGEYLVLGKYVKDVIPTEPQTKEFALYPNPSSKQFSITKAIQKVVIYDLTGQKLKSFEKGYPAGHPFDIQFLKRGIYIVKSNFNGQIQSRKLIVN